MPPDIAPSAPSFNLASGQSALLLGKTDLAQDYLKLAAQGGARYKKPARLWPTGVDYMQNHKQTSGSEEGLNDLFTFFQQQKL